MRMPECPCLHDEYVHVIPVRAGQHMAEKTREKSDLFMGFFRMIVFGSGVFP